MAHFAFVQQDKLKYKQKLIFHEEDENEPTHAEQRTNQHTQNRESLEWMGQYEFGAAMNGLGF